MADAKVTMRHVRQLFGCRGGAYEFSRRHGIDYRSFLRQGVDSSRLRETGDAMAIRVAELAEAEHGQQ